jgi:hypothetical protein
MKDENNYGDEILTICEFVAKKILFYCPIKYDPISKFNNNVL